MQPFLFREEAEGRGQADWGGGGYWGASGWFSGDLPGEDTAAGWAKGAQVSPEKLERQRAYMGQIQGRGPETRPPTPVPTQCLAPGGECAGSRPRMGQDGLSSRSQSSQDMAHSDHRGTTTLPQGTATILRGL